MKLTPKAKNLLAALAVFLAGLCVFAVFWFTGLYSRAEKGIGETLNDSAEEAALAPLNGGVLLSQYFTCDTPFYALGVKPAYGGAAPHAALVLRVYDGGGALLAEARGNAAETLPGQYAFFEFGAPVHSADGRYRLEFTADIAAEGVPYALFATPSQPRGWLLEMDGKAQSAALCLVNVTEKIGGFLHVFYGIFAFFTAAALAVLFFLCRGGKWPLHRLFAVAAASLGLLFCFILPPYSSPDEEFHINQTFDISSHMMGQTAEGEGFVRRASDSDETIENRETSLFTYKALARNALGAEVDSTPVADTRDVVGGYTLPYWPAALAVTLCRLLGVGFVPMLYVGRLVNLALFVLLASLSVKLAPAGKAIFAAAGLLPMTMHLAAGYSRDCFTIGMFMLYTALCLHYAMRGKSVGGRDMLLLGALALLAAPAKSGAYLLLAALCVIIPADKFSLRGRALPRRGGYAVKAGIAALAIGFALIVNSAAVGMVTGPLHSQPAVTAAAGAVQGAVQGDAQPAAPQPAAYAAPSDDVRFTVADFFQTPGLMLRLLLNTVTGQLSLWWRTLLGGSLGYYSLELDSGFVLVLTVLLCLAALPEPGAKRLRPAQRAWGGLLAAGTCGLVALGCVLWTPRHYTEVYGIQGRYFLPALPLALCCLSGPLPAVKPARSLAAPLVFAFFAVGCFALLDAFLLIAAR